MSAYRLPGLAGAWIDRSQKLNFNFDGRALQGYSGDSLASALLASGSMHVARSFKLSAADDSEPGAGPLVEQRSRLGGRGPGDATSSATAESRSGGVIVGSGPL